jgi:hypothetical protein
LGHGMSSVSEAAAGCQHRAAEADGQSVFECPLASGDVRKVSHSQGFL